MEKQNQLFTDEQIKSLYEKLENYRRKVDVSMATSHNYIIEIGNYTVGTDEKHRVILENRMYPTRFTKEGVEQVMNCLFKHSNGDDANPCVYLWLDWYKKQITDLETLLKLIETYNKL